MFPEVALAPHVVPVISDDVVVITRSTGDDLALILFRGLLPTQTPPPWYIAIYLATMVMQLLQALVVVVAPEMVTL